MSIILTDEQARERLKSPRNLVGRFGNGKASSVLEDETTEVTIIPLERPGRTNGSPNFSEEEKVTMGVRRGTGERLQSIANDFGTTPSVVMNIEKGKTKSNRKKVDELIEAVQDTALLKLMESLNLISPEKLGKLSAKDLGVFASSMSKVIGNTKERDENDARVHLHLYAPELRSENSFKTIEVRGA